MMINNKAMRMKSWAQGKKNIALARLGDGLEKKAIAAAKVEIAKAGTNIENLTEHQKEVIVHDEERKLTEKYKMIPIWTLMVILGVY